MNAIAVFDLDGTVVKGDLFIAFLAFILRQRPHRLVHCLALPLAVVRFKFGRLANDALKVRFLTAVAGGTRREQIERFTDAFLVRRLPAMVKVSATRRIAWHRAQGHRLLLASASLDFYAVGAAVRLGFDEVVCTRAVWAEQRLTGALDGANLRGPAKLAAVQALLGTKRHPTIYAYSDHHDNLPLLLFADHAMAVDPTPRLAFEAELRGLTIEDWGGNWTAMRTIMHAM